MEVTAKYIRNMAPDLFEDHKGGVNRRMVYGKPVSGKRGIFFVTSERTSLYGRKFMVRKLSDESGAERTPVCSEHMHGHVALLAMRQLSS